MKIYIAGKITGLHNYQAKFLDAQKNLEKEGHNIMNPAVLPPEGFDHSEYMHVCDGIYMLDNWKDSKGAKMSMNMARRMAS